MVLFFPLSPIKTSPSRDGGSSAGKMDRFRFWNNSKMAKPMVLTFIGGKTVERLSKRTTERAELTAFGRVGIRMDKSNSNKLSGSEKLMDPLPDGIKTELKRMIRSTHRAKSFP